MTRAWTGRRSGSDARARAWSTIHRCSAACDPSRPAIRCVAIHWRATARLGQPVSRRWEPARSRQVILVLDVQTVEGPSWEMAWDDDAFESLCVAAASLARSLLDSGASVGLAAAGFSGTAQRLAFLPPRSGLDQLGRVTDLLARLGPISSGTMSGLLTWLTRRVPSGASLVVLAARPPHAVRAHPSPTRRRRGTGSRCWSSVRSGQLNAARSGAACERGR